MTRFIAITSGKGGVGKTTSAINIAHALTLFEGKRVLLVDLDSSANSTKTFCPDLKGAFLTAEDLMAEAAKTNFYFDLDEGAERLRLDQVVKSAREGVDLIPANSKLRNIALNLGGANNREQLLRYSLGAMVEEYDFVLFDCPANLDMLCVNALCMGKVEIFIPIECGSFSDTGFINLMRDINALKVANPQLVLKGAYLTKFDTRETMSHNVRNWMYKNFKPVFLDCRINISSKLKESPGLYKTIYEHAPTCRGAEEYKKLTKLILRG